MSPSVARALACLGLPVTFVGDDKQPKKGTGDLVVAEEAKRQKRVLLTANFDMVMAACDTGARFIWFDARGKSPTLMETAHIVFRNWDRWERELADPSVTCIKVGRDSCEKLSFDLARKRAKRRFHAGQAQKRRTASYVNRKGQGTLSFEDDEE